jgi:hypothetical protein
MTSSRPGVCPLLRLSLKTCSVHRMELHRPVGGAHFDRPPGTLGTPVERLPE